MRVFLRVLCVALCASWCGLAFAQAVLEPSEIAFRQALKDMSNDLRLMCVAAHPDDEDGATLAYYRYKHGVKTYALIGTRGEGGQNEIGPELYEDLAVIRTKEMMAAAEIEGAELHFLDMPEFGFSKTIEETFEKWGKDVLLEKMVRKIREIRPHVIITHHGRMKDHGHHQAIGWAVQEAFTVAADAAAFPEAGEPWQVQRLFIRDFSQKSTEAVVIDISETDELRGKKYTEIAADALRAHKSQGMEQFINMLLTGEPKAYYDLVKEAHETVKVKDDMFGPLFTGMSVDLRELKLPETDDERWNTARTIFSALLERETKRDAAVKLLLALSASNIELLPSDPIAVRGQPIDVQLISSQDKPIINHYNNKIMEKNISVSLNFLSMSGGAGYSPIINFAVPNDLRLTIPKSHNVYGDKKMLYGTYVVRSRDSDVIDGIDTQVPSILAVDVAPSVLPEFLEAPYLIGGLSKFPLTVPVKLTNYTPGPHAQEVRFTAPESWGIALGGPIEQGGSSSSPSNTLAFNAEFTQEDEQRTIELTLTPPEPFTPGSFTLTAETKDLDFKPEAKVQVSEVTVIPSDVLGRADPEDKLRPIGLIDSYDTTFRDTMTKLGRPHERIGENDFTPEFLERFHLILVDMRSYLYRPDLKANNTVLLDWCKRGGTLIVNYHKTFDWSPDFAPYPISLSSNRVTREDAPVKLLVPEHPWFNHPNKITPEDWDGWRQERGLYFAGKWDDAYTPLIDTSDPGETIPPGSCLIADYGEGTYFYTSLVWYRQLRELHPGALKLFANMLML
jgi:LmbE family N-acetylglucosaminyl deacetylase